MQICEQTGGDSVAVCGSAPLRQEIRQHAGAKKDLKLGDRAADWIVGAVQEKKGTVIIPPAVLRRKRRCCGQEPAYGQRLSVP
jgi:hypothetical protein